VTCENVLGAPRQEFCIERRQDRPRTNAKMDLTAGQSRGFRLESLRQCCSAPGPQIVASRRLLHVLQTLGAASENAAAFANAAMRVARCPPIARGMRRLRKVLS